MNENFYDVSDGDINESILSQEITYKDLPSLKVGDVSDDVLLLEDKLRILGYLFTPVTRGFDTSTEEAVERFQKQNNLPDTGMVDERTWEILFNQTESTFPTTPLSLTRPTLRLGSTGEYVIELQTQLTQLRYFTGAIDGVFGPSTEAAVKAFQSVNKLTVDGVVGRPDWAALAYLYRPLAICGEISGGVTHIVRAGDTLFSIARQYGTTVDEIMRLNNLTSTTLRIGQELIIFAGTEEAPEVPGTTIHVVQAGDTLFSLARRFNTTVEEIMRLNNLTSTTLQIGQQLIVPGGEAEPQLFEYVVIAGDTLFSIARRYNTTVEEIMRLNNLTSATLRIGQILRVPRPAGQQFVTHTVRAGDTLYSLARTYNSTVAAIREANNLTSDLLNVGRRLVIPINII